MWDRAKEGGAQLEAIIGRKLVGVQGTPIPQHGKARVCLGLAAEKFDIDVIVADTPTADVILGRDFLRAQQCTIKMTSSGDSLHVAARKQSIAMAQDQSPLPICKLDVVLQESVVVPPCSEMEVVGRTPDMAVHKPWLVEGKQSRCAVAVARALVEPEANHIPLRVLNPRDIVVTITKGTSWKVSPTALWYQRSPKITLIVSLRRSTSSASGIWLSRRSRHSTRSRSHNFTHYC